MQTFSLDFIKIQSHGLYFPLASRDQTRELLFDHWKQKIHGNIFQKYSTESHFFGVLLSSPWSRVMYFCYLIE